MHVLVLKGNLNMFLVIYYSKESTKMSEYPRVIQQKALKKSAELGSIHSVLYL